MTSSGNTGKGAGKNNSAPGKKPLAFTPEPMTRGQAIAHGQEAAQLLNSPVFNLAFESTITDLQKEWLESHPEEVKKREWLYAKAQALGHVALELSGFAREAMRLSEEDMQQEAGRQGLSPDNDPAQSFMQ